MNAGWKLLRAAIPYLVALAIVISALWGAYSFGVRTENADRRAEVAELLREHQQTLAAMDRAHRAALQAELQRRLDAQAQHEADMAALDAKFTKEIEDANRRSAADVAAVRAGTVRVRDRFTCPAPAADAAPGGGAGQAGGPTGLGDGGTPGGLRPDDAAFLVSESDRADQVVRQLQACQAIVRRDRAK